MRKKYSYVAYGGEFILDKSIRSLTDNLRVTTLIKRMLICDDDSVRSTEFELINVSIKTKLINGRESMSALEHFQLIIV